MSKITVHNMKGYQQNGSPSSENKLSTVAERLKDLAQELSEDQANLATNTQGQSGRTKNQVNGNGTMNQQQAPLPILELTVSQKGGMPQKHTLQGDLFTFGRSEESDIVLESQAISRDHVHIKRSGAEWQVVDLGSTNGSYLSGRRLTPYVATKWHPLMQLHVGPFYINQRNNHTLIEAPVQPMPIARPRQPQAPPQQPQRAVAPPPVQEQTRIAPPVQSSPPTKSTVVESGFMAPTKQKRQITVPQGKGMLLFEFPTEIIDSMRQLINRVAKTGSFPEQLALTSALREEGVTYVSRALGATLANDLEAKVCVVELNWWNPSSLPPQADHGGLADILSRRSNLENALLRTNNPKLFLLPAGNMPAANRSIASRSTGLRQIMQHLTEFFDYIILDVPAVLTTSDAAPIASMADSCCLVVNQGATPIEDVKSALDELNHLPMLGTVMNKISYSTPKGILRLIS